MEQLDNVLPDKKEEFTVTVKDSNDNRINSPLLHKVRQNFGIFGGISLLFGVCFTFLFYQTRLGVNALLFTIIMVLLLSVIMSKLSISIKRATKACYVGAILLGFSTLLTSSWILQFLNIIGIILLLELSILHQLYEDNKWDFPDYLGRMIRLVFECIVTLGMPFKDCAGFFKNTRLFKNDKFRNICVGIIIAIPLLWVIVGLLSNADLLFGKMTREIYTFFFSSNLFQVVIMVLLGFIICYCIICGSTFGAGIVEKHITRKKANASIAVTILFLLCIVYVLFCSVQMTYLFANGFFVLPEEFTFAEYARRGFFELLTVTVINLVLMLMCTSFFEDSKFIRFLLTCMTACTYIMIGSAVYRMILYIGAYDLTFLRLFVLLFLLIDSFVLAGVITSVYKENFPLFGYCVSVVTVCYLMFSFSKPDYWIASYHIQQNNELESNDIAYLINDLSLDAAPVMVPYLSEYNLKHNEVMKAEPNNSNDYASEDWLIDTVQNYYKNINMEKERGIRDFNLSSSLALKTMKEIGQ